MKTEFSRFWSGPLAALLILGTQPVDLAAQPRLELVSVIRSLPIYDPSTYTMQCQQRWPDEEDSCIKVARPDKPFPLPIGFWTSVRRDSGDVQTFKSANHYEPGVRITVEVRE